MDSVSNQLSSATSIENLFDRICSQLEMGYCKSLFYDGQLQKDTNDEMEHILKLNRMHFWSTDSQATREFNYHESAHKENLGGIQKTFQRAYICGFMPRYLVDRFAQCLSKIDKFVGVYDHLNPDETRLYMDGVPKRWLSTDDNKMEDLVVKYHMWFDDCGNPFIKPYKHIYDYGSEIDELNGYFDNKELEKEFLEHYIEVVVVEPTFYETGSLFKTCADILEELKKDDWSQN